MWTGNLQIIVNKIYQIKALIHTLGNKDFPKALAPARMWLKFNWLWVLKTRGVNDSAIKPLKTSLSATMTLTTPCALLTADDIGPHFVPATRTVISPPIFLAAVIALCVVGSKVSLLCSAITKVDWRRWMTEVNWKIINKIESKTYLFFLKNSTSKSTLKTTFRTTLFLKSFILQFYWKP